MLFERYPDKDLAEVGLCQDSQMTLVCTSVDPPLEYQTPTEFEVNQTTFLTDVPKIRFGEPIPFPNLWVGPQLHSL